MKGGSNTNIDFNKEDLGHGPEQFDKLGVEEDVTFCSDLAAQLTHLDADKNVQKYHKDFLVITPISGIK